MGYTPETIKDLLKAGGNVVVQGVYTPESLKDFARLAKANNCQLTIKTGSYTPQTLKDIAAIANQHVTFEM